MSWSIRDSKLVLVVATLGVLAAVIAGASVVAALAVAALASAVVGIGLARANGLERRADHAAAETQSTAELTRILPLRAPLRPMVGWAMTPELGSILVRTILAKKPSVVVELGSGVSSVVNGYALELAGGGRVYSLDHDASYAEITRAELATHGLSSSVQVIDAPLVDHRIGDESFSWYSLANLPEDLRIDLLLVDGPPHFTNRDARYPALPLLLSRLAPGAVVILDDAARPGERAIVERWIRENEGRVTHEFHPTRKGVSSFVVRS